MSLVITPTAEEHFVGLHRALDIIAREKKFFAIFQAPSFDDSLAFYRRIVANDLCQFVALDDDNVVGWCDILPVHGQSRAHVGTLGIALLPDARSKGFGRQLMAASLAKARSRGFTRIELAVRTDNTPARTLYEHFGFRVEGLHHGAYLVDGTYFDSYSMALVI